MTVDLYNSMIAIRDDLRSNITDPISREGQWIHYDSPDFEKISKTPTVYIEQRPGSDMTDYVGSGVQDEIININIHVIVRAGDTGFIGGVQKTTRELMDTITKNIISRLEVMSTAMNTTYIKMIRRTSSGGVIEPTERLLDRIPTFEVFLMSEDVVAESEVVSVKSSKLKKRGSDCSGSDGDYNRILILNNTEMTKQVIVVVSGTTLMEDYDYTIIHNDSDSTITFLNRLANDSYIEVVYFL